MTSEAVAAMTLGFSVRLLSGRVIGSNKTDRVWTLLSGLGRGGEAVSLSWSKSVKAVTVITVVDFTLATENKLFTFNSTHSNPSIKVSSCG